MPAHISRRYSRQLWSIIYIPQVGFLMSVTGGRLSEELAELLPDYKLAFMGEDAPAGVLPGKGLLVVAAQIWGRRQVVPQYAERRGMWATHAALHMRVCCLPKSVPCSVLCCVPIAHRGRRFYGRG